MSISQENLVLRNAILGFEQRIEEMHVAFERYLHGVELKMPEWEKLDSDLIAFSRRKIPDYQLSKQMERVLYKFQNRKKIWLRWVEEVHLGSPGSQAGPDKPSS